MDGLSSLAPHFGRRLRCLPRCALSNIQYQASRARRKHSFHFENANVDPKFLTQLQALLAKRKDEQLRKAYRVLQATLEP